MHILYSILAFIFGVLVEMYVFQFVRMVGHLDWAEKYLGPGSTYLVWRLVGVGCIFGGFWGFFHSF